jgi:hypothetical protein
LKNKHTCLLKTLLFTELLAAHAKEPHERRRRLSFTRPSRRLPFGKGLLRRGSPISCDPPPVAEMVRRWRVLKPIFLQTFDNKQGARVERIADDILHPPAADSGWKETFVDFP